MVNYTPKMGQEGPESLEKSIEPLVIKKFSYLLPENPIETAIRSVIQSTLNGLPVLTPDMSPLGYLSEKDCLKIAIDSRYHNSETGKVENYMYNECHTIPENTSIFQAIEEFTKVWYHGFPVTDPNTSKVKGMIFRKDLLAYIDRQPVTTWFKK